MANPSLTTASIPPQCQPDPQLPRPLPRHPLFQRNQPNHACDNCNPFKKKAACVHSAPDSTTLERQLLKRHRRRDCREPSRRSCWRLRRQRVLPCQHTQCPTLLRICLQSHPNAACRLGALSANGKQPHRLRHPLLGTQSTTPCLASPSSPL